MLDESSARPVLSRCTRSPRFMGAFKAVMAAEVIGDLVSLRYFLVILNRAYAGLEHVPGGANGHFVSSMVRLSGMRAFFRLRFSLVSF